MSRFHSNDSRIGLLSLIMLSICFWVMSVSAQSVTWQILPWPDNQDWPGPRGSAATTNDNQIVLTGQDVLSVQAFSAPLTISYDVLLPAKSTADGIFELFFVPTGEPTNLLPNPDIELDMFETQAGNDGLEVQRDHGASIPWGPVPYTIKTQTVYHVSVDVAANGQVTWAINGLDVGLTGAVVVPYSSFQLRLSGWQPTQVWLVRNFTVTAPPTCPNIIGTWSGQVNIADPRNGYNGATLSLQVTDQSTNGCLLRGYLNTRGVGIIRGVGGRVPFTGTILDAAGMVLNVGRFGQASATLDMSQTPPVMKKFIFLSTATANGGTAVGDLTEETSAR